MLKEAKATEEMIGDVASWPAAWATETLIASREAFMGITFKHEPDKPGRWAAEFKNRRTYLTAKNKMQTELLAKAGARLAQVLNSIWP